MSAIATIAATVSVAATVAEEISLTQEVADALDALDLSEDSQDVSDTYEDVSDADAEEDSDSDSEDAKEDAMNVVPSSSTKEAVAQARRRISIQKSTLKAIQKAIHRDEEQATRIQCRVLKARAAHQAAELRLTIGCRSTRTKLSRVETTRHRLEGAQQELYQMEERVRSLRRSLQEAHDRLPVLQVELEAARHAHKEMQKVRAKQRQQQYREERLYQKERHAIGHLHPATESSEALSLCVKLLSGDLLTVEVHSADPVELLPRQFAEQHGYHLTVIPRMTFHLSQEDSEESEEKPEEPFVTGTSHLRGTRRTWKQVFPESQPPMLLFLLKESNDYSRANKLRLMHDILRRRQLVAMMEDDDLWSLYQAWNIHCSVHLDANRWQRLSAFVDDHLPHFVPLTQEMIREKQRRARLSQRLQYESILHQRTSSEEREAILRLLEELRPFFPASYRPLYACFIERIVSPTQHLQELIDVCRQRQAPLSTYGMHRILYALLHYLTLSHLAGLGIPASSLCDCHKDSCYICHYDQDSLETPQ